MGLIFVSVFDYIVNARILAVLWSYTVSSIICYKIMWKYSLQTWSCNGFSFPCNKKSLIYLIANHTCQISSMYLSLMCVLVVIVSCSEALTVHMTSLECNTDDELESTVGDLDEATDTETESMSDGMLSSYTILHSWSKWCHMDATEFLVPYLHSIANVTVLLHA